MLRIAALAAVLAGLSFQGATFPSSNDDDLDPLKFNADGIFQISVFSDLHFAEDASGAGPEQDRASVKVMADVLDFESPDLVVLNGDLISGESTFLENSTHYIDQIVTPIVDRNLTWASTYGNHDHNYNVSGDSILEREQRWPNSRTESMISTANAGFTNYYLPVYASNCTTSEDCTPELLLWFFDSRGGFHYQGNAQPNWVDSSVVTWFNETNAALLKEYARSIPSLAFVHIPVHATYVIQREEGINEHYHPGINEENVVQQGDGWCSEGEGGNCDYEGQDVAFMRALVSIQGIIGLFYGHDHGNSWCYKWNSQLAGMAIAGNGINLCYGQHTGYGGYGDWVRGARQILVTQEGLRNNAVNTHIRLESGEVVSRVSLNSTFNTDYYSSTPNQKTYLEEMSSACSLSLQHGIYTLLFMSLMTIVHLAI